MRETKVICDRCGDVVLERLSTLKATAGELAKLHDEAIDLCSVCADRFADFLKSGKAANHEPAMKVVMR